MNEDLKRFVLNRAVQSKLCDEPIIDAFKGNTMVFIAGYPFTLRGFYILTLKALMGNATRVPVACWKELHAETALLCQGLEINLATGREAFSVITGVRKSIQWNSPDDAWDNREKVREWVMAISKKIEEFEGAITPQDQPLPQ